LGLVEKRQLSPAITAALLPEINAVTAPSSDAFFDA
jgi:hypothetical protein